MFLSDSFDATKLRANFELDILDQDERFVSLVLELLSRENSNVESLWVGEAVATAENADGLVDVLCTGEYFARFSCVANGAVVPIVVLACMQFTP